MMNISQFPFIWPIRKIYLDIFNTHDISFHNYLTNKRTQRRQKNSIDNVQWMTNNAAELGLQASNQFQ
jgi:hypothetical protein